MSKNVRIASVWHLSDLEEGMKCSVSGEPSFIVVPESKGSFPRIVVLDVTEEKEARDS